MEAELKRLGEENARLKARLAAALARDVVDERSGREGEDDGTPGSNLPTDLWADIAKRLNQNDVFAFAMTCKQLREAQVQSGRELVTKPVWRGANGTTALSPFRVDWCFWVSSRFYVTETRQELLRAINAIAAWGGYTEVFERWIGVPEDKRGLLFDARACSAAAAGGHLEALKLLRSLGCPFDVETCGAAAYQGHLDCLRWARSQDPPCPWNAGVCAEAADGGHADILSWLRIQGCPWTKADCKVIAERNGHTHVVRWIDEQPEDSDGEGPGHPAPAAPAADLERAE